ncbi:GerAB/ArcD/ProY family transporter [Lederbergia citrea]|uniref:Endospore germination permease n=1 Tax=Lederbergia citrea TaxID=2833581 RepID=A0A942USE6_9BACI|nr:endospore germination permease [Lederbergia citrea]MBS4224216.1 endospore germination permease [Lederbergia citrea]
MGRVTQLQLYMLFSQFLFTSMIGYLINKLVHISNYMTWLALLLGSVGGLTITYLAYRLAIKRPTQFFVHYGKEIVGKWVHYPLVMIIIFSFVLNAAVILRSLTEFIIEIYLPKTPDWAIVTLFGICTAYAVRFGIQSIFRSAQGIFFASITGILVIPLLLGNQMNFSIASALITHFNVKEIWNGSYFVISIFGEMSLIVFLFPYFERSHKTFKSLVWASVTSVFIILSNVIPMILIFGTSLISNLTYPELELTRFINVGTFFRNFDALLITSWMVSIFIKVSLLLYVAAIGLAHVFSLKSHKPFSLSITALMIGLSLYMAGSVTELNELINHGLLTLMIFAELIPVIYLVVDKMRSIYTKQG